MSSMHGFWPKLLVPSFLPRNPIKYGAIALFLAIAVLSLFISNDAKANTPNDPPNPPANLADQAAETTQNPPPAPLPWSVGQSLFDGWKIEKVDAQSEFVRLTVGNGQERHVVEIAERKTSHTGPRTTEILVVQPAPNEQPPETLLDFLFNDMKRKESSGALKDFWRTLRKIHYGEDSENNRSRRNIEKKPLFSTWQFRLILALSSAFALLLWVDSLRKAPFSWRRSIFQLIFSTFAIFPLAILGVLLADLFASLEFANNAPPEAVLTRLKEYLAKHETKPLKVTSAGADAVEYYSLTYQKNVRLPLAKDHKRIYIYGGSSVVLVEGQTFADQLQTKFNEERRSDVGIYNFGETSYDSFDVRSRIEDSFAIRPPDVVVIYSGHNDYDRAYTIVLLEQYSFLRNTELIDPISYLQFRAFKDMSGTITFGDRDVAYYAFRRLNLEPALSRFFQATGNLRLSQDTFTSADASILASYKSNIEAILAKAAEQKASVILITLVGNFYYAMPIGVGNDAEWYSQLALRENDYSRKIDYFKRARDAEIFNGFLHAKSPINEHLRSISRPGVHLVDLEKIMIDHRRPFNHADFFDSVHLNSDTHALIAQLLYEKIMEENLLSDAPSISPQNSSDRTTSPTLPQP
ncbi:MAG: SGNH/GDSL hydrolase family protein [Myxococcales bacterium]|nr:MAG: SGNH/GDSL hydrolase family protein [Myxococcales bacterium]